VSDKPLTEETAASEAARLQATRPPHLIRIWHEAHPIDSMEANVLTTRLERQHGLPERAWRDLLGSRLRMPG
jgi:hypothetical protein